MSKPHDTLFRFVFSQPEHARGLLAGLAPPGLRDRIAWSTLRHLPGTFVAPELDQRHADVLFEAEVAGCPALLYLLLEHQSEPDPLMPLRVLGYVMRIAERHMREHPEARRVPLVLPIVVHHGERGWTAPRTYDAIVDAPAEVLEAAGPHVPRLELLIDDLAAQPVEALRARQMTAAATLALIALLRMRSTDDAIGELRRLLDLAAQVLGAPGGTDALVAILRYILNVTHVARPELRELFRRLGPRAEEAVMSTADVIREEGRAEGRAEGEAKAVRATTLRALQLRGLTPTDEQRRRLEACVDLETLGRWFERALSARHADDVFDEALGAE
jgi:predicted transposase/invertase (TIGR01784 family)